MCCFSRDVQRVSDTRILARLDGEREALAYAMQISAAEDLAMVLPIPVPADSAEDAVSFVDLSGYRDLFDDLEKGFPTPPTSDGKEDQGRSWGPAEGGVLEVHRVGAFDASFVPSRADFERLDERFRMPESAWEGLLEYGDWGYAVFKLRAGERQDVHPMAFTFPTRAPSRIFLPTVHVHDGHRPPRARFDHDLYVQLAEGRRPVGDAFTTSWQESPEPARAFADAEKARGLLVGDLHVHRRRMQGEFDNADTWVELA